MFVPDLTALFDLINSYGRGSHWCYLGKELPETIKKQLITQNKALFTQEFTQTDRKSNNPSLGSISEIKVHYLPSLNGIVASDK
jgi:hypothetical protein